MTYEFGDWVVYEPGFKSEVGRVTACAGDMAFVCYSHGCTAAATPMEHLRAATDEEVACADGEIGFHRFDEYCPERDDEYCHMCNAKKGAAE